MTKMSYLEYHISDYDMKFTDFFINRISSGKCWSLNRAECVRKVHDRAVLIKKFILSPSSQRDTHESSFGRRWSRSYFTCPWGAWNKETLRNVNFVTHTSWFQAENREKNLFTNSQIKTFATDLISELLPTNI
jgi:hypothetical protein